ncbi:MAG TPA: hypothetical protein VK456_15245 [Xanthobacteraceae bacterium]|nr:hypothetical protein [Xanthobacteraceae bacterium]
MTFNLKVTSLPPIDIGLLSPIDIQILSPLPKIDIGLDPINLNVTLAPIEIKPIDLSIRLKEFPSIRVHFPVDYTVCLALLGSELLSVHLCGQGQVITEPYVPNPCECRYLDLKPDTGTVTSP